MLQATRLLAFIICSIHAASCFAATLSYSAVLVNHRAELPRFNPSLGTLRSATLGGEHSLFINTKLDYTGNATAIIGHVYWKPTIDVSYHVDPTKVGTIHYEGKVEVFVPPYGPRFVEYVIEDEPFLIDINKPEHLSELSDFSLGESFWLGASVYATIGTLPRDF